MKKQRVLIIEDELAIAEAERLILEGKYEVHHAPDGQKGLEMAHKLRPDLIVLDLMLPGRGGYDVCFSLRQHPQLKTTKIVMVTAKNQPVDEDKGMLVGADEYLTKPFEPDELLHVISQVLNGRESD